MNEFNRMEIERLEHLFKDATTEEKKKYYAREIKVLKFLAECDEADLCAMINTDYFIEFIRGYTKRALEDAEVDDVTKNNVLAALDSGFDEYSAEDVIKGAE